MRIIIGAGRTAFPGWISTQEDELNLLKKEDFELVTTYENSRFCKPNPAYYLEIFDKLGLKAEECLMIGNDVTEDMVAKKLGCQVFLLTEHLINKDNADISAYPHGDFADLEKFLQNIENR